MKAYDAYFAIIRYYDEGNVTDRNRDQFHNVMTRLRERIYAQKNNTPSYRTTRYERDSFGNTFADRL
jgi:hypothetical protein